LFEENKAPFGIFVDGVAKMAFLDETSAAPGKSHSADPWFIRGIVFEEEQEILILDFERLFHAG